MDAAQEASRRYPTRPFIGVGAVVLTDDGRVVLVKRRNAPMEGQWSLPGGALELGETLEEALRRELREETGLDVEVGPLVEVFDRIVRDEHGVVQYHFVLADYLCRPQQGRLEAGTDVTDVALADPDNLEPYQLNDKARDVIRRARTIAGGTR